MDAKTLESIQVQLEQRRSKLVSSSRRYREEAREDRTGEANDLIDYAVNSYDKDFLLSLSSLERKELHLIEEAMARIIDGSYGTCQECGEAISPKRLEAVPWARHCLKCQELEEQGLLPSYHFK